MTIELRNEARSRIIESIRRYFDESLEIEIGDLKASLLLEFFLKEVAPSVYNQAIVDAQAFLQDKVGELEDSCFQVEFDYWKR